MISDTFVRDRVWTFQRNHGRDSGIKDDDDGSEYDAVGEVFESDEAGDAGGFGDVRNWFYILKVVIKLLMDTFKAGYKTAYCFTPGIDGDGAAEENSHRDWIKAIEIA